MSALLGQGAGETLRGTLTNAVDKRFNATPEALAANEEMINAGKSEYQTGVFSDRTKAQEGGMPKQLKGILRKPRGDVGDYSGANGHAGHAGNGGMVGHYGENGSGNGNGIGNGRLRVINE